MGREERCKQTSQHVRGALAVCGPPWVCPTHGTGAFPVYTAQAPGCPAGELSKVGPGLRALPRSKLLRFRFSGPPHGHRLGWAAFCALPSSEQLRRPAAWWVHCPRWALRLNHLPGSHPPVSLPPVRGWAGLQPANSPLVFTQFFVLWKSELELFVGKFSLSLFFFSSSLSGYPTVWVAVSR